MSILSLCAQYIIFVFSVWSFQFSCASMRPPTAKVGIQNKSTLSLHAIIIKQNVIWWNRPAFCLDKRVGRNLQICYLRTYVHMLTCPQLLYNRYWKSSARDSSVYTRSWRLVLWELSCWSQMAKRPLKKISVWCRRTSRDTIGCAIWQSNNRVFHATSPDVRKRYLCILMFPYLTSAYLELFLFCLSGCFSVTK